MKELECGSCDYRINSIEKLESHYMAVHWLSTRDARKLSHSLEELGAMNNTPTDTQPTPHSDSEPKNLLQKLYDGAYKCGVGARHPDEYRSTEAVVADAEQDLIQWSDRRAEKLVVEERIKWLQALAKQGYLNDKGIAALTATKEEG